MGRLSQRLGGQGCSAGFDREPVFTLKETFACDPLDGVDGPGQPLSTDGMLGNRQ